MSNGGGSMIERVASLGLDEFKRHLPYALRGLEYRWTSDRAVLVTADWGRISITLDILAPLALSGTLSLPRLRIGFAFEGGTDADHVAFIVTYDRAFQRGGG